MTQTQTNDDSNLNELPALDIDAVRPALLQLARATVDKTLQQARASGSDPVLGCSSALATFYMMMPRNDGKAQEHILDIVAQHVEGLTVITNGLKFGINPTHIDLVRSNHPTILAGLQTDYDPKPRGPSYRPDALVINNRTGKACLLEFKRQAATIETTKLNHIADNLTIARAQVCDMLYRRYRRMMIKPEDVSWAIIDCSDHELPHRFCNAGVFGLDSLDAICGVRHVAAAYRQARELMAAEFSRGETELMEELSRFIPAQTVNGLIEAAVSQARSLISSQIEPVTSAGVDQADGGDPEDAEPEQHCSGISFREQQAATAHDPAMIIQFPPDGHKSRRRLGMFGT